MAERPYLFALNGGEVSPLAMGRVDLAKMRLAGETCINVVPRVIGPLRARPGTRHLGSTRADGIARMIPFVFSADDTAFIELADEKMRVWVGDTQISRASVSTTVTNGDFSSGTGWTTNTTGDAVCDINSSEADELYMEKMSLGDTLSCVRSATVSGGDQGVEHGIRITVTVGPVRFRLGETSGGDEIIEEQTLDTGDHFLAFTPNVGTIYPWFSVGNTRAKRQVTTCQIEGSGILSLNTPWPEEDLFKLRFTQSGDVIYITSSDRSYQPRKIERRSATSWSLVDYEFQDGPFVGQTSDVTLAPSVNNGFGTLTASDDFFHAGHVGTVFRLSSPGTALVDSFTGGDQWSDTIRVSGSTSYDINSDGTDEDTAERDVSVAINGTWTGTVTAQISDSPDGPWRTFASWTGNTTETISPGVNNSVVYLRFGMTSSGYTSGSASVVSTYLGGGGDGYCRITAITSPTVAEMEVTKRMHSAALASVWAEGLFSGLRGWPSAVDLFDNRLWFGGVDRICGSVSDGYNSFDLEVEGDSGPIIKAVASGAVNTVRWILGLARLCMGTAGAEPVGRSSNEDQVVTPTNFSIKDASTQGSADVQAVKVDQKGVFIQRSGKRAYELSYDVGNTRDYGSLELTRFHPTILEETVKIMAVQRQPDTRVWFILNDGTAAVLLWEPDDDVLAWYRVSTDGLIEDVCVLPNTDDDDVYLIVNRTIDGNTKRYVEKMAYDSNAEGGSANRMADSYIVVTLSDSATVTGLSHLEGETVVVWNAADGSPYMTDDDPTEFTVTSGQITLPANVTGDVVVGLPYTWYFKSAKLAYGLAQGNAVTRRKIVNQLAPVLYKTHIRGIQYSGTGFTDMAYLPLIDNIDGSTNDTSKVYDSYDPDSQAMPGSWSTDSRFYLKGQAPLPCTVLSMSMLVDTR